MFKLKPIPKDKTCDSTLGFLQDGYLFISNRMKENYTNIFTGRFLGKKVIFLMGKEPAKLFYNETYFKRKGVAPMRVQKTLFGQRAIQGLDGAQHKRRKAQFMAMITPEAQQELVQICAQVLKEYAARWERRSYLILYKESQKVLFESVCQWVGIPYDKKKVGVYAEALGCMIYGFGRVGRSYQKGKCARKQIEAWVRSCVSAVRDKRLVVDQKCPLYQMSMYEEQEGQRLSDQTAAVELINLIRPVVAIATYVAFEAVAFHDHPETLISMRDETETFSEMFCQEVRRFYPFGPFIGAKVKMDFVWNRYLFQKDDLVVLDLYGTNHDPKLWEEPETFYPQRFLHRSEDLYDLIPQGGGSIEKGHRCAGDVITVKLMQVFAEFLACRMTYELPEQDLSFSMTKLPTLPKSGVVMTKVKMR